MGLWRHKDFGKRIAQLMHQEFGIPKKESAAATRAAYEAYEAYVHDVRATGKEYIDYARSHGLNIIVVCGRPYHIDPEINHGINDLITSFGFVLVTEDALSYLEGYDPRKEMCIRDSLYTSSNGPVYVLPYLDGAASGAVPVAALPSSTISQLLRLSAQSPSIQTQDDLLSAIRQADAVQCLSVSYTHLSAAHQKGPHHIFPQRGGLRVLVDQFSIVLIRHIHGTPPRSKKFSFLI